jgi:DNA-binding NarL/FixJ family response regulator
MSLHLTAIDGGSAQRIDGGSAQRTKVLIADDHPLIIGGIRRTLEHNEEIEVVGEARSGPELLELVKRRSPDLVLMDLAMPGVTGCECIERIHEQWPAVKIVVLSACDRRETIDAALHAGASAFVVKSAETVDVGSVIRQTCNGAIFHAAVYAPSSAYTIVDGQPPPPALTDRERSILSAVASGMTSAAISQDLWVSEHTVKFHLTNIYRKLGVSNRAGAVRYAFEHDLIAA